MSSGKEYFSQSFTMVRRAHVCVYMCFIQHSCWPLPKICSWFLDLQPPSDLRGETHISSHLVCVDQSLGQEDACSCDREKLQCKVHWRAADLHCSAGECLVSWGQTSTCSTNQLCLFSPSTLFSSFLPLHILFGIFSFPTTSCLYFPFLTQYIYVCGGECIGS